MYFFEKVGRRLAGASRDVAQKTQQLTETARLNGMIADAEKQIQSLYAAIGEAYYQRHREHPTEQERERIDQINELYRAIAQHRQAIEELKATDKKDDAGKCPQCGADAAQGAAFCNRCGAKLDAQRPSPDSHVCPQCHRPVDGESQFCGYCGTKLN